jgi:hypothetical protein
MSRKYSNEDKFASIKFDELPAALKEELRDLNERSSYIVRFLDSKNGTMCLENIRDDKIPEAHKNASSVTLKPPDKIKGSSIIGKFIYLPKGCIGRYLKSKDK